MNIVYGLFIAFSMYSKIPVPRVDWTGKRLRYVMCWFPLVGVVCGLILWLWFSFAWHFSIHPACAGMIGCCIPLWVSGGIHMDGFLDTVDARSSYGDREKKLAILKDPHTGAFAIIGGAAYLVFYCACMIQLFADGAEPGGRQIAMAFCAVFALERAFSGLAVASFPCAKDSGLARTFSDGAQKRTVIVVLVIWILALLLGVGMVCGLVAAGLVFLTAMGTFFYYRYVSMKEFGGITGDLAGWFLQLFEAAALAALAAGARWIVG